MWLVSLPCCCYVYLILVLRVVVRLVIYFWPLFYAILMKHFVHFSIFLHKDVMLLSVIRSVNFAALSVYCFGTLVKVCSLCDTIYFEILSET